MTETRKFSLVKPSLDTPFHIDFEWWKENDSNWRVYVHSCLCGEHQERYQNLDDDMMINWVDPDTGEVKSKDALQEILLTHCSKLPGFMTENTTLVDAVFRAFVANENKAMSPNDLSNIIQRPATTILNTLAGPHVYKGLRPCREC
ncbi:MAG: hypothetical protein AB9891_18980 [Anaerolineaceae bacterium]